MCEIWLVFKLGGYYFKLIDGEWICLKIGFELFILFK